MPDQCQEKQHSCSARFIQGDAGEVMVKMAEQEEHIDVVFMDPPRSGGDEGIFILHREAEPEESCVHLL